ncbi:probable F420-dependent oxidoreductase, MSMEG_2256 family [Lentzea albidocapillata subsp. violacea]|uniref:Probable F420-dependent oxidoreductase, MSMEG_2256 family n=1 Tax=Lentzea albidocapillata subsp. violacea TaxID=128104 RepID=A0A1G9HMR9_9PSEU|nr:TIGR03617 family F420-dependent LLM class oxidoreductase [Lentzea albidocapillata]SDL14268.1 probable F420-dependent oxidoreductase, MSMEG_2256 family [Lentzea albidocapillata subsp. violacea]
MKLDSAAVDYTPGEAGAIAKRAEDRGYDGFWLAETKHDPFLALAGAAASTERIELGTAIAVAFARNPMTVATTANDLQLLSGGRFNLGLGSQVEAHITKRFAMPWGRPAARMREFVLAIRAIWHAWETGERLAFRGEFYQHTLMTPFFDPGPNPHGTAPIYLAGVGGLMTEVAGEVADGFLCHNFTTERYLREVTLPALERGRAKAGKTLEGFEISGPVFAATNDQEIADVKRQIAFYGSTPAYRPVLDLHGWGALHEELHRMSRRQQWAEMSELITDEVLAEFCVLGTPETVTAALLDRYGDVVTRVSPSSAVLQRPEK